MYLYLLQIRAMTEQILIPEGVDKAERYRSLFSQVSALVEGEADETANLANVMAALKEGFDFFWVGIYLVKKNKDTEELVLGPFQGPVACSRIGFGKGVCGTAWKEARTVIVPDVEQFPGHIACSSLSRSEIVVPVVRDEKVVAVIDVDSTHLAHFDETDARGLEDFARLIATLL